MVMVLSGCKENNNLFIPRDEPSIFTKTNTSTPLPFNATPTITLTKEILIKTIIPQTQMPNDTIFVLSPISGIPLDELSSIISNPFQFPSKGKDDGHPGLDFSFYTLHEWKSIENLEVVSILQGNIAGIINDRPPYGNAIIVETRQRDLNIEQLRMINTIYPEEPGQENIILNCPGSFNFDVGYASNDLSLYVLYGHLKDFQDFKIGDFIESGNILGKVGSTGMSGNPHLHLEIRIGPNSAVFLKMAHYDNSITEEERENYCLWRVSGYFFPINPDLILGFKPTKS
jgi:murein DD-endopeptidase MepM/ murein hydrolase activator NlpD